MTYATVAGVPAVEVRRIVRDPKFHAFVDTVIELLTSAAVLDAYPGLRPTPDQEYDA